ncbi:hypothetical protein [Clostridium grantii]|uniref:TrkA-N domain-containing protein n=1 Tax=Clostridium grantii DSM 8605 TaxID=1121316 RepID=A0A1M5R0X8_9CLOT|nr:hypothetical protein [Clostridium grantii]SHH19801.1 hypothetical protein SAMN02745207_00407 [Clostridium grantii DSM 8605]
MRGKDSNRNITHWYKKLKTYSIISFLMWIAVVTGMIIFFVLESNKWRAMNYLTVKRVMFTTGSLIAILIFISLLALLLIKRQAMERKFLMAIAFLAIALGIIGYSNLIFERNASYFDAVYKSIQLFTGGFDEGFNNNKIPAVLNVARFLAVFVSFGTIVALVLKEKLRNLKIKIFYRDVLIIADKAEGYIVDLAENLIKGNRKVVIGYTSDYERAIDKRESEIPIISVDVENDIKVGLKTCNVKNAKVVYLLCNNTEDNVKLAKNIYEEMKLNNELIYKLKEKFSIRHSDSGNIDYKTENSENWGDKTNEQLIKDYLKILNDNDNDNDTRQNLEIYRKKKSNKTVCYIQYLKDQERNYYSIDKIFNDRSDNFVTYFINPYDIAIRQMLSKVSVVNSLKIDRITSLDELEKQLKQINIVVSGTGDLLDRTFIEIAKNCVYNNNEPMKMYYMDHSRFGGLTPHDILPNELYELVELEVKSAEELSRIENTINLFFISSIDEKEIQSILQKVFQYDLQNKIHEYMILTKGNDIEYSILQTYIKSLLEQYYVGEKSFEYNFFNPIIHISSVTDLMMKIDEFYEDYGPKSKDMHKAYGKAFKDNEVKNFSNLSEIFRDSNVVGVLHNEFIIDVIDKLLIERTKTYTEFELENNLKKIEGFFNHLSITEHERWYIERKLQQYIYSKEQSEIYNKNPNLKHWKELSDKQKYFNLYYLLQTLITQRKNKANTDESTNIYKDIILEYKFDNNQS